MLRTALYCVDIQNSHVYPDFCWANMTISKYLSSVYSWKVGEGGAIDTKSTNVKAGYS